MSASVAKLSVAVYGICKDEERFIERCLLSAKDADVIVFGDTGSKDGTLKILKRLEKTLPQLKIVKLNAKPFRFDDARNAVLAHVPADIDVCVSLDADEILSPDWRTSLENAYDPKVTRYNHKFKTVWNWEGAGDNVTDHWHERIHTRKDYYWRSPVHEFLRKTSEGEQIVDWIHSPFDFMIQMPDMSKDRSVYLEPMKIAIEENPDQWKIFWFLQEELRKQGKIDEANAIYGRMKLIPGVDDRFCHLLGD